ncbi:MAG: hypothetical protein AAF552_03865 [Pseudomonadota bacterium]
MAATLDPTEAIRTEAAGYSSAVTGKSCNQQSFKVGKGTFLFIGPGPKGQGYKAMFKLDQSMPQARELAEEAPQRFEVGKTGWVTARFSADQPLPARLWKKWLKESYQRTSGAG